MKKAVFLLLVIVAITGALIYWLLARQQADPSYAPQAAGRAWITNSPAVAIDDAHWNTYTAARGYVPFAKLLLSDGFVVIDRGNVAAQEVLDAAKVVVIVNALGPRGVIRQAGQLARINLDALAADAFSDEEADRLENWVREGGSLLLVADPAPAGRAVQSIADRFGVTMRDSFVHDPEHSDQQEPTFLVFTRETKTLGAHPIITGRGGADAIDRVVTFTGQAVDGPPHATKLLIFSGTAYETSRRDGGSFEDRTPVPGLAQALALTHGRGRVVVVGDAELLTSQLMTGGGQTQRIGLQWPNSDNERFARHIMRWLSHAGE